MPSLRATIDVAESNHLRALDGLRGVLALSVFAHHAFHTRIQERTGAWDPVQSAFVQFLGLASVATFFMITAFLFWSRISRSAKPIALQPFYTARLRRLYPAFALSIVAVLVVVACLAGFRAHESPAAIARECAAMFLLGFRNQTVIDGVTGASLVNAGVTWSLAFEFAFYAFLPLYSIVRNRWIRLAAVICGVLLLASYFDAWVALCFLPGILVAEVATDPRAARRFGRYATRISVAACVALAVTFALFPSRTLSYQEIPTGPALLQVFAMAAILLAVVFGGARTFLARPEFVLLGAISYGVYLFHGTVLFVVTHLMRHVLPVALVSSTAFWCVILAVCLPLTLCVSLASYLEVELRFMKRASHN